MTGTGITTVGTFDRFLRTILIASEEVAIEIKPTEWKVEAVDPAHIILVHVGLTDWVRYAFTEQKIAIDVKKTLELLKGLRKTDELTVEVTETKMILRAKEIVRETTLIDVKRIEKIPPIRIPELTHKAKFNPMLHLINVMRIKAKKTLVVIDPIGIIVAGVTPAYPLEEAPETIEFELKKDKLIVLVAVDTAYSIYSYDYFRRIVRGLVDVDEVMIETAQEQLIRFTWFVAGVDATILLAPYSPEVEGKAWWNKLVKDLQVAHEHIVAPPPKPPEVPLIVPVPPPVPPTIPPILPSPPDMGMVVVRFQFMAQKPQQKFGNRLEIRRQTEASYQKYVRPLLREDLRIELDTVEKRIAKFPELIYYGVLQREDDREWRFDGEYSDEKIQLKRETIYTLEVERFDSPEAITWGSIGDEEVYGKPPHIFTMTMEEKRDLVRLLLAKTPPREAFERVKKVIPPVVAPPPPAPPVVAPPVIPPPSPEQIEATKKIIKTLTQEQLETIVKTGKIMGADLTEWAKKIIEEDLAARKAVTVTPEERQRFKEAMASHPDKFLLDELKYVAFKDWERKVIEEILAERTMRRGRDYEEVKAAIMQTDSTKILDDIERAMRRKVWDLTDDDIKELTKLIISRKVMRKEKMVKLIEKRPEERVTPEEELERKYPAEMDVPSGIYTTVTKCEECGISFVNLDETSITILKDWLPLPPTYYYYCPICKRELLGRGDLDVEILEFIPYNIRRVGPYFARKTEAWMREAASVYAKARAEAPIKEIPREKVREIGMWIWRRYATEILTEGILTTATLHADNIEKQFGKEIAQNIYLGPYLATMIWRTLDRRIAKKGWRKVKREDVPLAELAIEIFREKGRLIIRDGIRESFKKQRIFIRNSFARKFPELELKLPLPTIDMPPEERMIAEATLDEWIDRITPTMLDIYSKVLPAVSEVVEEMSASV